MNEITKTILSIIGLVSVFIGGEFFLYWVFDKYNKHELSYLLHGFVLFLVLLESLYS